MIRFRVPASMKGYGDSLGCHAQIICTEFSSEAPRTEVAIVKNTIGYIREAVVLMARE